MRLEPFRDVVRDSARHFRMAQGAARKPVDQPHFRHVEPGGAEAIAVTGGANGFCAPASDQHKRCQRPTTRSGPHNALADACDPPIDHRPMAQHRVDMAGDLRPVLGADIATATEVVGRGIVGGASAGFDLGQDVDRGRNLRAWGQNPPGVRLLRGVEDYRSAE